MRGHNSVAVYCDWLSTDDLVFEVFDVAHKAILRYRLSSSKLAKVADFQFIFAKYTGTAIQLGVKAGEL